MLTLSALDFKAMLEMSVQAALATERGQTGGREGGDSTSHWVLPSDRQAHDTNRLKGVQSLFTVELWNEGQDAAVSAGNRLETFATNFLAFLSRDHFAISKQKTWTIALAKHFVCADWTIGGGPSSVGLHYFTPTAKISCIHDFTVACGIWAECEHWLRGPHMKTQINALHMRLIMLSYDEPQIGGAELATCVEVMAMDLRQHTGANQTGDGVDGNSPAARVGRALQLPISPRIQDERTLSRYLRNGAHVSTTREWYGKGTGPKAGQEQKVGTKRPREEEKIWPVFASDPDHRMCWKWVQKGEPKSGCPSQKGSACRFQHVWPTGATAAEIESIRAQAKRMARK